ncbi:MerR family transcriptional regulator [Candidatus Enterococcus willemsii]|uniref:HTH merR-type domain-containing protein n=1 Tax=Candidatus Enterococcus willemsii TaxID=1857215 RepID=A0ABQ6YX35_9ENTE|nr:MerR family transcriptional regulator [Enterococcus sp. CU12B]KAF1302382.1 hypothetical protein BAU17_08990 [Enterococcus sp. CU12B]
MTPKYFTIKEIAALYGISTHTIRHYEKLGLVNPKRLENNYRVFSLTDIYNLNIIRDLRGLNVSLETIQAYLSKRNIEETNHIIQNNRVLLENEIAELNKKLAGLDMRAEILAQLAKERQFVQQMRIKTLPERQAFQREVNFDGEASFETELLQLYGELLDIKNFYDYHYVGGVAHYTPQMGLSYESVFVLDNQQHVGFNQFSLPAGEYASYLYEGTYHYSTKHVETLLTAITQAGYEVCSPIYEFYLLDFHETNQPSEYLTELQIQVKKA